MLAHAQGKAAAHRWVQSPYADAYPFIPQSHYTLTRWSRFEAPQLTDEHRHENEILTNRDSNNSHKDKRQDANADITTSRQASQSTSYNQVQYE